MYVWTVCRTYVCMYVCMYVNYNEGADIEKKNMHVSMWGKKYGDSSLEISVNVCMCVCMYSSLNACIIINLYVFMFVLHVCMYVSMCVCSCVYHIAHRRSGCLTLEIPLCRIWPCVSARWSFRCRFGRSGRISGRTRCAGPLPPAGSAPRRSR